MILSICVNMNFFTCDSLFQINTLDSAGPLCGGSFGNRLGCGRAATRRDQSDLANRLGKRQQYVSKYESRERRLDVVEFVEAPKRTWRACSARQATSAKS